MPANREQYYVVELLPELDSAVECGHIALDFPGLELHHAKMDGRVRIEVYRTDTGKLLGHLPKGSRVGVPTPSNPKIPVLRSYVKFTDEQKPRGSLHVVVSR